MIDVRPTSVRVCMSCGRVNPANVTFFLCGRAFHGASLLHSPFVRLFTRPLARSLFSHLLGVSDGGEQGGLRDRVVQGAAAAAASLRRGGTRLLQRPSAHPASQAAARPEGHLAGRRQTADGRTEAAEVDVAAAAPLPPQEEQPRRRGPEWWRRQERQSVPLLFDEKGRR